MLFPEDFKNILYLEGFYDLGFPSREGVGLLYTGLAEI
jgi:hypothetical protein